MKNIIHVTRYLETIKLEKDVEKFILSELEKNKLTSYEIIKKIKSKFNVGGIDKIARKIADNIAYDKYQKKNKIKYISLFRKGEKRSYPYYYIGDDAKEKIRL